MQAPTQERVNWSFLALGAGDALARVIAFGAAVYVGRTLGPENYGILTFATGVLLYFKNLTECGIDLYGVRWVAEDRGRIEAVAPTLMLLRLAAGSLLCAALFLLTPLVLPELDALVLAFYGLTLLVIGVDTRWIHLGLHHSRSVAVARAAGELTLLVLVLLFVDQAWHLTRVPLAQVAGDLVTATILFCALRLSGQRLAPRLDVAGAKAVLARSWPLIVNVLLGLTIFNADLLFLRVFRDRETVGWYAAAYQLVSFLINIAAAYSLSLLPALTKLANDRAARDAMHQTSMAQTFALALPIAVGGSILASDLLTLVFGPEFGPSGPALAILILSMPFTMSKEVDLVSLLVSGREKTIMRMTGAAVLVNLTLILALIPKFGIPGAAAATLTTEIARAAIARVCAARGGYPWTGLGRRWKPIVATAAMAGLLLFVPMPVWLAVPAGVVAWVAVLFLLGGLRLRPGTWPALNV